MGPRSLGLRLMAAAVIYCLTIAVRFCAALCTLPCFERGPCLCKGRIACSGSCGVVPLPPAPISLWNSVLLSSDRSCMVAHSKSLVFVSGSLPVGRRCLCSTIYAQLTTRKRPTRGACHREPLGFRGLTRGSKHIEPRDGKVSMATLWYFPGKFRFYYRH